MNHVQKTKAKWAQESDPYDQDGDGIPDLPNPAILLNPLATAARYPCKEDKLVECLYLRQPLVIDGTMEIDPEEFGNMAMAVYYDLQLRNAEVFKSQAAWQLKLDRYRYDTPFWNGYGIYKGKACINSQCYERQEINYIAQGMWSAASGETWGEGAMTVVQWKTTVYGKMPSPGTLYWYTYGYYFYQSMNYHSKEWRYNK